MAGQVDNSLPNAAKSADGGKSDLNLNPVVLKFIGAAIFAASGLTTETMFQPKECHLHVTVDWALQELAEFAVEEGDKKAMKEIGQKLEGAIGKLLENRRDHFEALGLI